MQPHVTLLIKFLLPFTPPPEFRKTSGKHLGYTSTYSLVQKLQKSQDKFLERKFNVCVSILTMKIFNHHLIYFIYCITMSISNFLLKFL